MLTTDQIWDAVVEQRLHLAELTDDQWQTPSWCSDWTVKECAAHTIQSPQVGWATTGRIGLGMLRHGYNGAIREEGRRRGRMPVADLLAEYETWSRVRRGPVTVTEYEPLIDVLVHTQDILRPLGRHHDMPPAAAATAAGRARTLSVMMGAGRTRRLHLVASDVDWQAGPHRGPQVTGPISELLLLLCGRPHSLAITGAAS